MMGFSRLKATMTTNCDTVTNIYLALTFAILLINLPVSSGNPVSSRSNYHAARNIRHLPCIVRKSGLSGVCMFAIDCIKQNGTHLGTCIDRFYFGSCCQLKEEAFHAQEILDNSIDQNTISHFSHESTTHHPTSALYKLTTELNAIKNISRNDSPLEHKEDAMELTTVKSTIANSTTVKISTTTPSLLTTIKKESSLQPSTVEPQKFSTFQTVDTTTPYEKPAPPTTIKPLVSRRPTTTTPTTQRPKITRKPITTSIGADSSSSSVSSSSPTQPAKTTVKPKPQITKRPATTRKPISQSTKRPPSVNNYSSSNNSTTLNGRPKPSRRPIIGTTSTATKLSNNATTLSESTVTTSTTVTTTTSPPLTVATTAKAPRPRPKPTAEIVKVPKPSTTEKAILTTKSTTPATTTTRTTTTTTTTTTTPSPVLITTIKPSLVTWTEVSDDKVNKTEITNNDATPPSADWVPVPTIRPDNDANKTVVPSSSETTLDLMATQGTPPSPDNDGHNKNSTQTEDTPVITTIIETTEAVPTKKPTTTELPIVSSESIENISESEEQITETQFVANETIPEVSSTTSSTMEGVDYRKICGRRMYPQPRIVGGSNAAFGRWPWQISLRQWRTSTYLHKCGAALLNENWAITAAHCVDNVPPSDLLLRLGEYDLAEEEEPYGYQERKVQIVASHPQFDQRTFEYDLALLRFYEPVVFQPNIVPVCVPDSDKTYIGQTAYVTGWGRLYEDGPLPSVLQEVAVPVINNTICEAMYYEAGYKESIPHIFICAGWRKGGYDSCEGDSGGPMVLQREEDKRFILGGVISWGIGCAEPNQPGVYTRISEFRDWINQILQF